MGVGDASLNMKILYTQHTELYQLSQEVRRETDQSGDVQSNLQGSIKLNPLLKNTEIYFCTPMYRFITCRMANDSTSTLQAHTANLIFIVNLNTPKDMPLSYKTLKVVYRNLKHALPQFTSHLKTTAADGEHVLSDRQIISCRKEKVSFSRTTVCKRLWLLVALFRRIREFPT